MTFRAVVVASLASSLGCSHPAFPLPFPVELRAEDDRGDPVAGVRAEVVGRALGTTDLRGVLRAAIPGRDGDRVAVHLTPPPSHRPLSTTDPDLVLQLAAPVEGGGAVPQPLRIVLHLAPRARRYAILVLADGTPGLPVRVDGAVRTSTDDWGVAEWLHEGTPGSKLSVAIDTGARSGLRPRSPRRTWLLPDRDDILVVRQEFREDRPGPPRRRSRRALQGRHAPRHF
jgi:hypothetical protein